jgi:V8-like Glu-specific endopeptidase
LSGLVEVAERENADMAAQRRGTQQALTRGDPEQAATAQQRMERARYKKTRWPVLVDEEGFVGRDGLWSSFLARGARCAGAVGRVVLKDRPAANRWQGTAFLISDWVAVTNQHVIDTPAVARASALELDYDYDENGDERPAQIHEFDPDRLFISDRRDSETDYAVVAVKSRRGVAPGRRRGFLPLIAERGKAQNGDPLNLIHHPSGLRKRITVRESQLLSMDDYTLHYSGKMLGASSGAPVFNDQWEVVGLHFGGMPKRDARGRRLTFLDTVWDPSMSPELVAYDHHVGARVSSLIYEWKGRAASLAPKPRRLLLDALGDHR